MNNHRIKAICNAIAASYGNGGHTAAAGFAGVCKSEWSRYCSYDNETTIPMARAIELENNTGRRDFTLAWAERLDDAAQLISEDPRVLGARALEALAKAEIYMAQAFADGSITETEKRVLGAQAQQLVDRAQAFAAGVAAITPGNIETFAGLPKGQRRA